jgi:hypothetical protein
VEEQKARTKRHGRTQITVEKFKENVKLNEPKQNGLTKSENNRIPILP